MQRNEKLCNKLKTEINQNEFCQERDIQNGFLSSRYEIAFETKIRVEKLQADSIIWFVIYWTLYGKKIHITSVQTFRLCRCCFQSVNKNRDKNNNKNYRKITRQKQINLPLVYSLSVSLPFPFTLSFRPRSLLVSHSLYLRQNSSKRCAGKNSWPIFLLLLLTLSLSLALWLLVKMKKTNLQLILALCDSSVSFFSFFRVK